jgi:hypothetical protein
VYLGPEPWFGWLTRWSPQTITIGLVVALLAAGLVWRASRSLRWVWLPIVLVAAGGLILYGVPETRSYRVDRASDALTELTTSLGWQVRPWTTADVDCPFDSDVGASATGTWHVSTPAARDSILHDLRGLGQQVWYEQGLWSAAMTRDDVDIVVRGESGRMSVVATYGC